MKGAKALAKRLRKAANSDADVVSRGSSFAGSALKNYHHGGEPENISLRSKRSTSPTKEEHSARNSLEMLKTKAMLMKKNSNVDSKTNRSGALAIINMMMKRDSAGEKSSRKHLSSSDRNSNFKQIEQLKA